MLKNRLNELDLEAAQRPEEGEVEEELKVQVPPALQELFERVEALKAKGQQLQVKTRAIHGLEQQAVRATASREINSCSMTLQSLMNDGNRIGREIKEELNSLENEYQISTNAEKRIKTTLLVKATNDFVDKMRAFQNAQRQYKDAMEARVQRQVRLVKPDATNEEITMVLEANDPGALYRLAAVGSSGDIALKYAETVSKHHDILKLEKSIVELNRMAKEINLMVQRQGEMLNQIDQQTAEATEYVERGNDHLKSALTYRISTRKKKICLIVSVIILLLLIVLIILWKTGVFNSSSNNTQPAPAG